jgi:hypothetical protein
MGRYKHGDWNAECDRCGIEYKASKLKETWDNLRVCKGCFETRHPLDMIRGVPDDTSVPWTRPAHAASGGTDIAGTTVPPTRVDTTDDVPSSTFNVSSPIT